LACGETLGPMAGGPPPVGDSEFLTSDYLVGGFGDYLGSSGGGSNKNNTILGTPDFNDYIGSKNYSLLDYN
jgi:hypothetical protein